MSFEFSDLFQVMKQWTVHR